MSGERRRRQAAKPTRRRRVQPAGEPPAAPRGVKEPVKASPSPTLPVPVAIVFRKVGLLARTRSGRGFSVAELGEVGLSPEKAVRLGLRMDRRRHTKHEANVEALRRWLGAA